MITDEEIKSKLCELVENSIKDNQLQESVTFKISQKVIDKIWKKYFIDLNKYSCEIHSNDIRHIYKEHPDDIKYICEIHYYMEKFLSVEKSSTRDNQTGKNIPCLVFRKVINREKIKIVKLNISRKKI
jgi:hypothetical protein